MEVKTEAVQLPGDGRERAASPAIREFVEQLLTRIASILHAERATLSLVEGDSVVIEGDIDEAPPLTEGPHTATLPLLADNQVVGTIAVSRRRDEPFQESELATLRDLGGLVVLALRNTVLLGEAQKAANRLGTSEERFRLLVESVKDYAIFLLDPAGHVSSWNQGAERIKGYTTAEIVGRHFSTFYSTEDILAGRPARGLATAEREGRYEDEGWRLRKDGTRFWASVVITALRDETGRLRGFAKVTRDLTERKRIEDQLLEAERREAAKFHELAERMAGLERMKSEFLNLASHELRTPVSLIRGYLSLFEEGDLGELNERGRRALTVLRAQARDLNSLIEQMLEAAHLHDGGVNLYPEPLDLGRVASDGVAAVRDVSQGKPRIVLLAPEEPVPVVGDLRRLRTIVESLLDNAVKYSPNREEIICMVSAASDRAYFKIEDRGLGLDQEQLDQLFSSFGRIVTNHKADISGAGLGLYLARELARLHGGDVSAESDPGQGSVYTLSLPLAARRDETPLLAGDDAQGAAIPSTSGAG